MEKLWQHRIFTKKERGRRMATEMEILEHAKSYLDQLANGINPLTGEQLPDADIVNNVRISRCLFYTSDVLRQIIARGGLHKTPKGTKPFSLTEEQIGAFQYFDRPMHITAITERINSLIDDREMRKLSYRSITSFLTEKGYLRELTDIFGKKKREPTEAGLSLGISTEERFGRNGNYEVVLYNVNAQQFILDHLHQIAEAWDRIKSGQESSRKPAYGEMIDPETGEIIGDDR